MAKPPIDMTTLEIRLEILRLKKMLRFPFLADPAKVRHRIGLFQFTLEVRETGTAQIPV